MVVGAKKATTHGFQLRGYLEVRPSITLPQHRRVLRVHNKERSSIEHYQKLTVVQSPEKSSKDFLIRTVDL